MNQVWQLGSFLKSQILKRYTLYHLLHDLGRTVFSLTLLPFIVGWFPAKFVEILDERSKEVMN